jgi:hypothetical protein
MKYDYSISVARVLAMLSIIVCHLLSACHINDFQIAAVMVDVFLFISGYLYGLKQIADGRKWLKARFRRIIVPQWVNLAIYGVLCGAFCKPFSVLGGGMQIVDLQGLWRIFKGFPCVLIEGLVNTWFVTVIFLCYLLLLVVRKIDAQRVLKHWKIVVALAILVQAALAYSGVQIGYLLEFFVGFYLAKTTWLNKKCYGGVTFLFILSFALRMVLRHYWDGTVAYDDIIASMSCNLTAIWFVMTLMMWNLRKEELFKFLVDTKAWRVLDISSYPLYLTHYMFIFGELSVIKGHCLLDVSLVLLCTCVASVVVLWITERRTLNNILNS